MAFNMYLMDELISHMYLVSIFSEYDLDKLKPKDKLHRRIQGALK